MNTLFKRITIYSIYDKAMKTFSDVDGIGQRFSQTQKAK
jgi:hypothetical protein